MTLGQYQTTEAQLVDGPTPASIATKDLLQIGLECRFHAPGGKQSDPGGPSGVLMVGLPLKGEGQESVLLHVWLIVCIVTLFLSESGKEGSESGAAPTVSGNVQRGAYSLMKGISGWVSIGLRVRTEALWVPPLSPG